MYVNHEFYATANLPSRLLAHVVRLFAERKLKDLESNESILAEKRSYDFWMARMTDRLTQPLFISGNLIF
jgi:hypothetical protein